MLLKQYLTNCNLLPQFIVSKIALAPDGTVKKLPCDYHGNTVSHMDPANWMTYEKACQRVIELGPDYRVGFSITADSGLFLIDVDKAYHTETGWSELTKQLCSDFHGAFIETSQSGKGVHIMARYTGERPEHKNKNKPLDLELYTGDRFVMFGGHAPRGDWSLDFTDKLKTFINTYMSKSVGSSDVVSSTEEVPYEDELLEWTDDEIIEKCYARIEPSHLFGGTASFKQLFEADYDALVNNYSTDKGDTGYDESGADLALANKIAVFTVDEEQIIRIMWRSALVRDKWSSHKTYLARTVSLAVQARPAMRSQSTKSTTVTDSCQELVGGIPQEFKDCYYILSAGQIYHPQNGYMSKADFNVVYGGRYYPTSGLDPKATSNAYKSFEGHAKLAGHVIHDTCFRPDLPSNQILNYEGEKKINIYQQPNIIRLKGDASPFYNLLDKIYPHSRDQQILLSYMARCVQSPGVKANWCPVLQGGEGIGKSTILQYVAYTVGRRYTHSIEAKEFDKDFNSQWYAKVLLFVEDPPIRQGKLDVFLKKLITEKEYSFEKKQEDRKMGDFLTNLFITTNDKDLIRKTENTRRYSVFLSPLQTAEEIFSAGLTNAFFERLNNWNSKEGGFQIVAELLHTYPIDEEFDFAGVCVRGPDTSTTVQAIRESRTDIEVILQEEIDSGRVGFRGGWISSTCLNDFLSSRRISHLLPDRHRGKILKELGYIHHPHLEDGRVNRIVMPDNKKSRLFIHKNHANTAIVVPELIARAYEDAQKEG